MAGQQQPPGQPGQGSPGQGPSGRGAPGGAPSGVGQQSRIDYYKNLVDPRVTAVAGVGAWIGSFVLSFFVVTFFSLEEETVGDQSGIEMAYWMFAEGIGGLFESGGDPLSVMTLYSGLDSNFWGVGPVLHYLLPAIVLIITGRAVAGHFMRNRPNASAVDTVVVSAALAVPFVVMVLLGSFIFTTDGLSYDIVSLLLMGLAYSLVFVSIGATMRTRAAVTSINGLIAGAGAYVVGMGIWYFIVDPFSDIRGVDGFGDLQGSTEQFNFLAGYLNNHALAANRFFPEWYVVVAALVAGAALVYYLKVNDPIVGMGKGAHVGVGYFILATLVAFAATFTRVSDAMDYDTWPDAVVADVNSVLSTLSAQIVLAGVVYPVAFAAIGGAIGAKAYETQSAGSRQRAAAGPQQGGSQPSAGAGGRGSAGPGGQQSTQPPVGAGGRQGGGQPPSGGQPSERNSPSPADDGRQPSQQGGSPPPAAGDDQPTERGGRSPPTENADGDDESDDQPPQR